MKTKKIATLIIALIVFLIAFYQKKYNNSDSQKIIKNDEVTDSLPFNYLPTSTSKQVVKHQYYTLSYNEKMEQSEWVAYVLKPSHIKYIDRKRPFFIRDKEVKTKSADYRNYKKSGYDKGHLCPAGDRRFSAEAFKETFLTSNISPQNHQFNAGIWNRLEQKTRYWAKKYGTLYVVTGGVLTDSNLEKIGREKVAVPKRFYKILLHKKDNKYKAIAFLIQAKESKRPLYTFVTSIDAIEKLTGIDFFHQLPDSIENKIEAEDNYKKWSFR